MSRLRHCDDGPTPEKSPSLEPLVANDSTPSQMCKQKRSRSATPELARNISEEISNNIQATRSSATSVRGSTGNAEGLQPFWNRYTQAALKKWWLPKRTDCAVLDQNLWSGSLRRVGLNSWCSVQTSVLIAATCSLSQQCLWHDIMGYAPPPITKKDRKLPKKPRTSRKMTTEEKPPAGKARRIHLFPTHKEWQRFRGWMGAMR